MTGATAAFTLLVAAVLPSAAVCYAIGLLFVRRLKLTALSQTGGFVFACLAAVIAAFLIAPTSTFGSAAQSAAPAGLIGAVLAIAFVALTGRRRSPAPSDRDAAAGERAEQRTNLRARFSTLGGWWRLWIVLSAAWALVVATTAIYRWTPPGDLSFDERQRWWADIQQATRFTRRVTHANGTVEENPYPFNIDFSASDPFRSCATDESTLELVCDYTILERYDNAWPRLVVIAQRCVDADAECVPANDRTFEIVPGREVVRERIRAITDSYTRHVSKASLLGSVIQALAVIVAPVVGVPALALVFRGIVRLIAGSRVSRRLK